MTSNSELVRNAARQNYEEIMAIYKYCSSNNASLMSKHISNFELFSPALRWIIHAQLKGLDIVDPLRGKSQRLSVYSLPS